MTTYNNNLIKQTAQCCVYCGKSYKKRSNLDKHIVICELLQQSKKGRQNDDEEVELPSQRKMFTMLIELGKKYNKLEEKVDELNKWVVRRKKRINVVEWLDANMISTVKFENLIDKVKVIEDDVEYLMNNSIIETMNRVFSRSIYNLTEGETPIIAFVEKANMFYVYGEKGWAELEKENLVKLLNQTHTKINRYYYNWKKEHKNEIEADDTMTTLIAKTNIKMMSIEFSQESTLSKMRSIMYSKLKKEMKGILEYEFDFS